MSKKVVAVYVLRLSNWPIEDLAVLRGAVSLGAMESSCVIFEKAGKDGLITESGTVIDKEEVEEACLHLIGAKNYAKPAPIVKNAVQCGICGGAADLYSMHFQCQANHNHVADLFVGIFTDLSKDEKHD